MKKKVFFKRVLSLTLALALAFGFMMFIPKEAKAATSSFVQDIVVSDETDGAHIAGIRVPEIAVQYRIVPEVTTLPSGDNRYNGERGNYPDGNSPQDTKVIEYEKVFPAFTSNGDGKDPIAANNIVDLQDINELKDGTANWGANGKVYRYHLNIIGIYRTDDNQTIDKGRNLLNMGNLIAAPAQTEVLMDVYIGSDGKMGQVIFWDKSGSEKTQGFAAPSSRGRAATADNSIKYNVYDVEVSTDYIGNSSNSVAGKVIYNAVLENLPDYLTNAQADAGFITSAITGKNKDSWSWNNDPTDIKNGKTVFEGALSDNDKVVFGGLPYEGADGNPIKFSASIDYSKITDLAGQNVKEKYSDAIYFAANVERIDGSVQSMTDFVATDYGKNYSYDPGINEIKSTDPTPMVKGDATSDNNVRFVVFDPEELVIVGVILNTAPGVIAIVAAAFAGVVAFAVAHKRRKNSF